MWDKVIGKIRASYDTNHAFSEVQKQIAKGSELYDQIQSFAFLQGTNWVFGHYDQTIKQHTLGVTTEKSQNVYVHSHKTYRNRILVVVSFNQLDFPPICSKRCSDRGKCYVFPYSTLQGCRCNARYTGDKCETSDTGLKLKSVVNTLLENAMKLPSFASIQHAIEDTQLYLKTSTEHIQASIKKLGDEIDKQFKKYGDIISKKFEWFTVLLRYKEAIQNLNYFYSLLKFSSSITSNITELDFHRTGIQFSKMDDNTIAKFLLQPNGIRKWLYQINLLIVGKMNSQFNSHKPLLYMVIDRYKSRLCFPDYKREITRAFRQLHLLQLKGYILWSSAYSILNHDSSVIARDYKNILKIQEKSLHDGNCEVNIPNSDNLQNCTGGLYIHKSMNVTVSCYSGYFFPGKIYTNL